MTALSNLSDEELVDLLKSGNHAAYTEIYNRFSGLLYLHAYNKMRNREEARDIVQELFTVLWNNREELSLTTSLTGYLYTSVRNRILKIYAHQQVTARFAAASKSFPSPETSVTDHRVRQNLLTAMIEKEIDALPPKMREIFLLSRKQQLSHKEIAELLDIAEPTVKKQVNNALKILRVKLGILAYLFILIKF